jgi:uncharacterized protein YebE (UPF0316 family)
MIETNVLVTGVIIFIARVCDVSIGTLRTIITVQGRTVIAFFLALFEITIWILVASKVINQIHDQPILVVFYAFGFATGNVVGILVERKLALGIIILKVITRTAGKEISESLREKGQAVTVFIGEGLKGPVTELYIACRRRDLPWILPEVQSFDQNAFYIIEQARDMRKILTPTSVPSGGWHSTRKQK